MELVIVLLLISLQCVRVSPASHDVPLVPQSRNFPDEVGNHIPRKGSHATHLLQNERFLTKTQAKGNIATTLLRNFDTREIKVVYLPTSIEDQGVDQPLLARKSSGSETTRGKNLLKHTRKPTDASIPVIIIERHIGYQIPGSSSPKEPTSEDTDEPESNVRFFPHPISDPSTRDDVSDREQVTEKYGHGVEFYTELPPEVPPPYHGQGEYRRRYAEVDHSIVLRRDSPSDSRSEQRATSPKNTGIFVKAGRVLSEGNGLDSPSSRGRFKLGDHSRESTRDDISPLQILIKPSESLSTKQRFEAFSLDRGSFFGGENAVTSSPVIGTDRADVRERPSRGAPGRSLAHPEQVPNDPEIETLVSIPDDFIHRGGFFREVAEPPGRRITPSVPKPAGFSNHATVANKPVVNPLTGWVQTPAVRSRVGEWPSVSDLTPEPVPKLEEALPTTRRRKESALKVSKRGWRQHSRQPSWTIAGARSRNALSQVVSNREGRKKTEHKTSDDWRWQSAMSTLHD